MKVGFIGLGNVGSKLAKNLINNNFSLCVLDLNTSLSSSYLKMGAEWGKNPKELAISCDVIITCLLPLRHALQ